MRKYVQNWVQKHKDRPSYIDDSWEDLEENLPLKWGPDAFQPQYLSDDLHTDIGNRLRDPKQFEPAIKDLLAKLNLKQKANASPKTVNTKISAAGDLIQAKITGMDVLDPVELLEMEYERVKSAVEKWAGSPAWQRSEGKNDEGGLNAKGRASYNKATGGHLKAPVTEKNPTGKAKARRHSFCSRMCGMKKHETGSATKKDPDSRINKSLRKWNCKCSAAHEFGKAAAVALLKTQP